MNTTPVVSVIMPLYNKEHYVQRAIESVQAQRFNDWELIIIDDGSTDDSLSKVPTDDPRIRIAIQSNSGPSVARNHGIKLAKGEYLFFLDADDYFYPGMFERSFSLLSCRKRELWLVTAFDVQNGEKISTHFLRDSSGKCLNSGISVIENAPYNLTLFGIPPTGICVRKKMLRKVGGFNESMRCLEIAEFVIRCALEEPKVLVNNKPSFRVVKVPNSAYTYSDYRLQGRKALSMSLLRLSRLYPFFSSYLIKLSRQITYLYAVELLRFGRNVEAKKILLKQYPANIDKKGLLLILVALSPLPIQRKLFSIYDTLKYWNFKFK